MSLVFSRWFHDPPSGGHVIKALVGLGFDGVRGSVSEFYVHSPSSELTTHMVWYILFIIFATYAMLPLPLLWSVVAAGVTVVVHLTSFIVVHSVRGSDVPSPWEVCTFPLLRTLQFDDVKLVQELSVYISFKSANSALSAKSKWCAITIYMCHAFYIYLCFVSILAIVFRLAMRVSIRIGNASP